MSEDAILRLQQTGLFKKLLEKENEEIEKTSLVDHEISQNIISVVRKAAPLLERIPENMPEFTLHNANHSVHVIENIEKIIPCETLKQLNAIEISILIYAAYLHDIGMIASSDDRKQIVKTSEFKKHLTSNEELYEKFEKAKNNGDYEPVFDIENKAFTDFLQKNHVHYKAVYEAILDIENKAFTDFLRKNHVERAHKLITEYGLDSEISWKSTSYYEWVKAVCESHGLSVTELKKNDNWPIDVVVGNKPVNVQYLSLVLRLADILDLDSKRTPKHLFYHINPKDKISIQEWEKHLSITGFRIEPQKIKIEAKCESPNCERVLREFIETIDKELEESKYLISSYRDDFSKYKLNLSESVDVRIRSIGYEYRDFRFELDYRRVLDLLMGEGLYGDPVVALRELIQNSVDAVRYRESIEKKEGNGYQPSIEVSLTNDKLIVEDNGIGMDEEIFKNYFMKVGRSYYQSSKFRQKNLDVDPVSEFGIGILSVFMVANRFTVESRRKTFEDEFNPSIPIYFEIPTAYDYFVKRQSKRSKPGTKITLYLKLHHPFSTETLMEKISKIAPFIEYKIKVDTEKGKSTYEPFSPKEYVKNEDIVKEYFEVSFDKKEGIEGKLRIFEIKDRYNIIPNHNIFAQKGFAIPSKELLPRWLSNNIQASINLSGQSKLSLSPSRSYVVKDEKYKKLIGKMQSNILEGLENYLKVSRGSIPFKQYAKIFNELLEYDILTLFPYQGFVPEGFIYEADKLKNEMGELFLKHAPLLTISEAGQKKYKMMKDLDITNLAIVGINDLPEKISDAKILEEAKRFIGAKIILLMQEEEGIVERSNFLEKILGNSSDFYITSIPGVVIETFQNTKYSEKPFSISYNRFIQRMHNYSGEKTPLLVHVPGLYESDETKIIYNAYHPLFARHLNGEKPKDEASSKAIHILINQLDECLSRLYSALSSSSFIRNYKLQKSANINYMLIGILKYYPQIFYDFYNAVEQYWKEAKDLGVISHDEDFIGFSFDDLPWFWNYEFTDFEI
jgi:molecular chaperone HtpG